MTCTIKKINDHKGMQDFLDLPYRIYRDDPNWVAPLQSELRRTMDPDKNPYFEQVDLQKFVCYRDGEPVARAITVINLAHWKKFDRKTAFFGFYESLNDPEATTKLFHAMEQYCVEQGAEYLEGPFNPNHYSELGLLVRNFTAPVFFETYNPAWYAALLEQAGFKAVRTLHTRINRDARTFMNRRPAVDLAQLRASGYTVRPFNLLRWKADLACIREVFNDAFAENWHFLPVSSREYGFLAASLFLVTNPGLIRIVEHRGRPVGVLQCVLNINPVLAPLKGKLRAFDWLRTLRRRLAVREIVIFAAGIKKASQHSRVIVLLTEALRQIVQRYPVVYSTWMTEDNLPAIGASAIAGLEPYKWFEIYEKTLTTP